MGIDPGSIRATPRHLVTCGRGFTILELILVVILLSILALSAAPGFLQTRGFALEGAASMIAADIRYAQESAMTTHNNTSVVFVNGNTFYTAAGSNVNLPAGVGISSTVTFTFNPLGEPTAGGGGSVTVGSGGDTKSINVETNTGRVSIS